MHFHLPKPLHGWREFAGEVGIIVLGVLIALGAEQLVEAAHWRSEARSFGKAVDQELGRNLGIYDIILRQRPCVTRRLAELERFLADSRMGKQDRLARPIGSPERYSQYSSVWDNRGAEVTAHLPGDLRSRYGELYDEFANNDLVRTREREVWQDMSQFDQAEPLDHSDRMHLRALLNRAEYINTITTGNYDFIFKLARPLGIRPIGGENLIPLPGEESFCKSLLAVRPPASTVL
jgi:hypothetical protein